MMTKQTMTSRLLLMIAVLAIGPVASGQSLKAVPRPAARVQRQSTVRFQNRQTAARLVRAQEPDLQMREESSLPAPSAADLERRRAEKQQRFMQIIDRLKNLQNQMQQAKEDRAAQQEIQDPSDTEQLSVSTGSEATMVDLKDPVDSDSKPPEPEAPTESDVPNSTLPDLPATDSGVVAGSSNVEGIDLSFEVLVDGPVNRVAAADNLYRIKEYKLALEMYAQVDVRQLSDDQQFWVQFQTASCHRRLGDLKAAREQFRIIAGQPESGWMGRSSRWWLDTIRDRAELEEQLNAMQEQISMKKELFNDSESK